MIRGSISLAAGNFAGRNLFFQFLSGTDETQAGYLGKSIPATALKISWRFC